jgi:tumor protein p53-inducible protein 3
MMKAITIKEFGPADNMHFDDVPIPEVDSKSILVKVHATALNRADLLQRRGKYPAPPGESEIMGLEVAGEIVQIGTEVKDWKVGDRVMSILAGGGYAQYCAIPAGTAMPIPKNFSYADAAAVPEAFLTAYQGLKWLGNLEAGQDVLIHAGAGGVGSAAIQIAQAMNALRIFTTAGSDAKLQFCKGLGATHTINYKSGPFLDKVLHDTEKRGVNVVLDFIGADYLQQNIDALKVDGTLVILGFLGGTSAQNFNMASILSKRLTMKGSTLRSRSKQYKSELSKEFIEWAMPLFESKQLKPVIDREYNWTQAIEAHKYMESNSNMGKIVLNGVDKL